MRNVTRRALLKGGSAVACVSALSTLRPALAKAAAAAQSTARVELRISVYKGHNANFFGDAGVGDFPYTVTYSEFPPASNLLIEAVSSGALDLAGSSNVSPIFVSPARARFRQISAVLQDANNYVLVVPKGSPIRSVEELKGKNVGYLRATTPHYFLLKTLKAHGLSTHDIKPIPLMQQDGYTAFKTGQVDAWAAGGMFSSFVMRDGAKVLAEGGRYFQARGVTVANLEQLRNPAKRAAIADYLHREKKTMEWIEANPNLWAAKMQRLTQVDAAVYLEQFRNRSNPIVLSPVNQQAISAQQDVVTLFVEEGLLPQRIDVTGLWDASFSAALA